MRLIFCSDPMNWRVPDAAYAGEVAAAERLGIRYSLVSLEALVDEGDADRAVRHAVPAPEEGEVGVYCGWMMTPDRYAAMYEAFADRRVVLINTPEQYALCHHLPRWYAKLEGHTPRSVWTDAEDTSLPRLMVLLRDFGDGPVIVADYVESRRDRWLEACFIPSAADVEAVGRVTRQFLALQGTNLNGGLVLREFVPFESVGIHPTGGMPLTREFRVFFLDGEPIYVSRFWDQEEDQGEAPPMPHFTRLASAVGSRFFTMDVAKTIAGQWMVVELADAQVAELPDGVSLDQFLQDLKDRLS